MTERLHFHFSLSCTGKGNGNPLQCSCLENPRDWEPGGLLSLGSHRVGHDWRDLAAAWSLNEAIPCKTHRVASGHIRIFCYYFFCYHLFKPRSVELKLRTWPGSITDTNIKQHGNHSFHVSWIPYLCTNGITSGEEIDLFYELVCLLVNWLKLSSHSRS